MPTNEFSLQSLIRTEAAADPAFVFDGTPVSRAEFSEKIEQTTAWLAARGIGKGDVIAVWLVVASVLATRAFGRISAAAAPG